MAYTHEVKELVRNAYVRSRLSLRRAAEKYHVAFESAARWKRQAAQLGDDWDKARAASVLAGEGRNAVSMTLLETLVLQYEATLEQLQNEALEISTLERVQIIASLTNSFHKAMNAHAKLAPELSELSVAMEVIERLGAFVKEHYPKHTAAFLEILEPFGKELGKLYG